MKLTQILPQTSSGVAPYQRASPQRGITASTAGEGIVAGAIGKATSGLDEIAGRALDLRAKAEAAKQKVQDETDAGALTARFEVAHEDMDLGLRVKHVDPKAYLDDYKAGVRELQQQTTQGASPGAVALFNRKLPDLLGDKERRALQYAGELYKGDRLATLEYTQDEYVRMAGGIPFNDPDRLQAAVVNMTENLGGYVPLIGAKAAAAQSVATRNKMYGEWVSRAADKDPAGLLAVAEEGSPILNAMDPQRRDSILERASNKLKAIQSAEATQWDKTMKSYEEGWETERQQALMRLSLNPTPQAVEDARTMSVFKTAAEHEHYKKMSESPKTKDSDDATYKRLFSGTFQVHPTTTRAQLDEAYQAGLRGEPGLSERDWKELTREHLSRTLAMQAEQRTIAALGRSEGREARGDRMRDHAQAEQELRAFFGINALTDVSDKRNAYYSEALREMTRRSSAYQGTESPLSVANEIQTRFLGTNPASAALKEAARSGILPGAGGQPATEEELKGMAAAGAITKQTLIDQLRKRKQSGLDTAPLGIPPGQTEGGPIKSNRDLGKAKAKEAGR